MRGCCFFALYLPSLLSLSAGQEKNLEARERETRRAQAAEAEAASKAAANARGGPEAARDRGLQMLLKKAEADFMNIVRQGGD